MHRKMVVVATALLAAALVMVGVPAYASGPNVGWSWEENFGTRIWGKVQVQPCYNDYGRHARQGYQRFTRKSGPALDTGRLYTPAASGTWDCNYFWRTDWVWDSPLYGDDYTTRYSYGIIFF